MSTNYLGVSRDSRSYASKTQAALTRKEFNDFLMYSYPALQQQAAMVGNPVYLEQQQNQARADVSMGLADAPGRRNRMLGSYGLSLTPEQQAITQKDDMLNRSAADVDAYNRATQQVKDREWQIMSGVGGANWRPGGG